MRKLTDDEAEEDDEKRDWLEGKPVEEEEEEKEFEKEFDEPVPSGLCFWDAPSARPFC